jgi:hypothetical protein
MNMSSYMNKKEFLSFLIEKLPSDLLEREK